MSDGAQHYMVLTAVGPDRPGLVNKLSAVIHRAGANLEDSRMAVLAGEFALIVLVAGPAEALARVREAKEQLEAENGFAISFKETGPRAAPPQPLAYHLEVSGLDQPGIVHHVTEVLASYQINIASLDTHVRGAPFSGTPIFELVAEIEIPDSWVLGELQERLDKVCEESNLRMTLERRGEPKA